MGPTEKNLRLQALVAEVQMLKAEIMLVTTDRDREHAKRIMLENRLREELAEGQAEVNALLDALLASEAKVSQIHVALEQAAVYLEPDIYRGPASTRWVTATNLVRKALAAAVPSQEPKQ